MTKKILYVSSCHEVLEHQELDLFTDLGVQWFSTGIYLNPTSPHSIAKRPSINYSPDQNLIEEFIKDNPNHECDRHLKPRVNIKLTKSFIDKFDLIILNNFSYYLTDNFEVLKTHKNVFIRTYYYSTPEEESLFLQCKNLFGLKTIRMFSGESQIPNFAGCDFLIPNFVNGNDFNNWNGSLKQVLTFQHDMQTRMNHIDNFGNLVFGMYHVYWNLLKNNKDITFKLYGYNNQMPIESYVVDFETQKQLYKDSRVCFSLGSSPGPYTFSFLEAMSTGTPTINFGKRLGDYNNHPWYKNSYIVPDLIENGVDGFYSDNPKELISFIKELLNNDSLASNISSNARKKILNLFGRDIAKTNWISFFKANL